jgi:hypothetical protein
MSDSAASLTSLAAVLRDADTEISSLVRDSDEEALLGRLAASGPRAAEAPKEYVLLVEAIREGYLLHYGTPRLIDGADPDLRLLAGDYLYALGLERLAARGDLDAVRELADLISLSAQIQAEDGGGSDEPSANRALWLAAMVAVGVGASADHERAKQALRQGEGDAPRLLMESATRTAEEGGILDVLERAAHSVGFAGEDLRTTRG